MKTMIAIIILLLFKPDVAGAYLLELSLWQNPANGKYIFIGGDGHNMGNQGENAQQLQFLDAMVLERFENAATPLQILLESKELYNTDINSLSREDVQRIYPLGGRQVNSQLTVPFFGRLNYSYTFAEEMSTWIKSDLVSMLKERNYKNVFVESIDPRLPENLWYTDKTVPYAGLASLLGMARNPPELDAFLNNSSLNGASALFQELRRMDAEIQAHQRHLIKSYLETLLHADPTLGMLGADQLYQVAMNSPNKHFIDQLNITPGQLRDFYAKISQGNPFYRYLDKIALWKALRPSSAHFTLLVVGMAHKLKLEESFQRVGLHRIYETLAPLRKKIMASASFPLIPGSTQIQLPPAIIKLIEQGLERTVHLAGL